MSALLYYIHHHVHVHPNMTSLTSTSILASITAVVIACLSLSSINVFGFHPPQQVVISTSHLLFESQLKTPKEIKPQPATTSSTTSSIKTSTTLFSSSSSWLKDAINLLGLDFNKEKLNFSEQNKILSAESSSSRNSASIGHVIRTASKEYHSHSSKPSSPLYTTKKESKDVIYVSSNGVSGDYNHYRTVALKNTPDRAISILTSDVFELFKSNSSNASNDSYLSSIQVGDLGENIFIDGISYNFFQVGKQYRFQSSSLTNISSGSEKNDGTSSSLGKIQVTIEITEPIEPCGNLCKLPYINDENLTPKQRVERCKHFLLFLDQKDGMRGWYAKVIQGGSVKVGDSITMLEVA